MYFALPLSWEQLTCPATSRCTRFLLVADPQILGRIDEPSWVTIWDNDRYLHRTFTSAMSFSDPDAVLFLGDLMDEGSRADDFEFQSYVDRFFSIFPLDSTHKVFFLPGDNDIGGENGDPILPSTVDRFRHIFHKSSELVVNRCRVLKVNPVLEPIFHQSSKKVKNDKFIRIAVSHFPLLGQSTSFTEKMLNDIKPHVIFSAHSHLSRLRGSTRSTASPLTRSLGPVLLGNRTQTGQDFYDDDWMNVAEVNEIEVPTCSYRMGVANMGYGYALFDETKQEFQYVVLWLPKRLHHLKLYLAVPVIICLLILGWWCWVAYCRPHHNYSVLHQHA